MLFWSIQLTNNHIEEYTNCSALNDDPQHYIISAFAWNKPLQQAHSEETMMDEIDR